jgi:energy-converting hydrogenase A subunit M
MSYELHSRANEAQEEVLSFSLDIHLQLVVGL